MFAHLRPQADDPILVLMRAFQADPRPGKVDLGIGVWRDAEGRTPVFGAVKTAEERLWRTQDTKSYVSFAGDPAFHAAVGDLLLGSVTRPRAVTATTGGTSAVQTLLALSQVARPAAQVWIPAETWPNHRVLAEHLGLATRAFTYLAPEGTGIDREVLLRDLAQAQAGDVVILHACCHNPTGIDPDPELQAEIVDSLARTGAVPLVDCAYLGFGAVPEADAAFLRRLASLPEAMLAFSGSKSFGLYRERVGLALVLLEQPGVVEAVQSQLTRLNRVNYSFPPDHGARVVTEILADPALRTAWEAELAAIRTALSANRQALAKALRARLQSDRFDGLAAQSGMFAMLPLGKERVMRMREDFAVYAVGTGRVNLAGVTPRTTDRVAEAIAAVLRD
ncbi:amino-acid aminotransferase [Dinoroseobacter shibae DFL 12 = DSM 16493]|jgi:aromatic-amino-acid transaminase|uniref:Amino-acid aminotransferase n=1 Tax=Dinoroseobacter shibae (strain DSM 16493 / NCIMB 14021 / DFL 12) TaxID=398580 RepID=A8LKQ1_DINSH|nr:amino acid aminotransferase [Dinoroseobacter shibae]ABV91894.1 amino-acid aminotransferase [Dinoroseobacter shibae DFL 12 = DSM 16493]URF46872.1 aspartate/tyrosine/aromatic aminotransferase [Dinoroseobacter shibae]URF51183.1 aspartate/tyrosine/aromatic aminotransferase [Dinoroseobacter shibae]